MDIPVYNWGLGGIGNRAIFSRITQCDIKNKFTERDLIIVVWSSWSREDRYIQGRWNRSGNVLNNKFYDRNFIRKYWDWENDIITSATSIISANKLFDIFFNGSIVKVSNPEDDYVPNIHDQRKIEHQNQRKLLDFYADYLPDMVYYNTDNNSFYNKTIDDPHPDIMLHKEFVIENIYKPLNITMKESTKRDVEKFYEQAVHSYGTSKKNDWEHIKNTALDLRQFGNWQKLKLEDWNGTFE